MRSASAASSGNLGVQPNDRRTLLKSLSKGLPSALRDLAPRPSRTGAIQNRNFALGESATVTRRRIASERDGLSGCCLAQSSICDLSTGDNLTAVTGSCPVAGRPRLFRTTGIDFAINMYYVKSGGWKVAASHRP